MEGIINSVGVTSVNGQTGDVVIEASDGSGIALSTVPAKDLGDVALAGTSNEVSRADHVHQYPARVKNPYNSFYLYPSADQKGTENENGTILLRGFTVEDGASDTVALSLKKDTSFRIVSSITNQIASVYTTLNKPTPAEIGALATTGGTVTGTTRFKKGNSVHHFNGVSGQTSWVLFAQIQILKAYQNSPLIIEMIGRGRAESKTLYLIYENINNVDPNLQTFYCRGSSDIDVKIVKISESTWNLYAYKLGPYDGYEIIKYSVDPEIMSSTTVAWLNEAVDTLPEGAIEPDLRDIALSTAIPKPLAMTPVVGISNEAARADHVHEFPERVQKGGYVSLGVSRFFSGEETESISVALYGYTKAEGGSTSSTDKPYYINLHKNGKFSINYRDESGNASEDILVYTALTPPPYPVTSVNGQTGDVVIEASGGSGIVLSTTPAKNLATTPLAGTSTEAARADHVHKFPDRLEPTPITNGQIYAQVSGNQSIGTDNERIDLQLHGYSNDEGTATHANIRAISLYKNNRVGLYSSADNKIFNFYTEANKPTPTDISAVAFTAQTLTPEQQAQARVNIGNVYSPDNLPTRIKGSNDNSNISCQKLDTGNTNERIVLYFRGYTVDSENEYGGTKTFNIHKDGNISIYDMQSSTTVKVYSSVNPPPYPVTSVNGQTGDVVIETSGSTVGLSNAIPKPLANVASAGTGTEAARADHVHEFPTTLRDRTATGNNRGLSVASINMGQSTERAEITLQMFSNDSGVYDPTVQLILRAYKNNNISIYDRAQNTETFLYSQLNKPTPTEISAVAFTPQTLTEEQKIQVLTNLGLSLADDTPFDTIELNKAGSISNSGGIIDFHFNGSTEDFTSRITETSSGVLDINGVKFSEGILSSPWIRETPTSRGTFQFSAYTPEDSRKGSGYIALLVDGIRQQQLAIQSDGCLVTYTYDEDGSNQVAHKIYSDLCPPACVQNSSANKRLYIGGNESTDQLLMQTVQNKTTSRIDIVPSTAAMTVHTFDKTSGSLIKTAKVRTDQNLHFTYTASSGTLDINDSLT